MFVNVGVPTCSAVLHNLMYKMIGRIDASENDIISIIVRTQFCKVFLENMEPLALVSILGF